ncbi:hypothetical protein ACLOJK_008304 [Asimina triloba]
MDEGEKKRRERIAKRGKIMTLNLPRRAVAPLNSSEDNLISSISVGDKAGEGLARPPRFSWGLDDPFDLGGRDGRGWGGASRETVVGGDDILDLLPSDPFGMELELGATLTRIAGWFGDFEIDGPKEGGFFPGWNLFQNQAMVFEFESGNLGFGVGWGLYSDCRPGGLLLEEKESRDVSSDGGFLADGDMGELLSTGDDGLNGFSSDQAEGLLGCAEDCSGGEGGVPHDALLYALSYLGVKDLLTVERVCKTMHSAVQNDALLWRRIYIEAPLSSKITDDALLQLTSKAQGRLQYLNLVECSSITDEGLMHVLESNPRLTKLCVRGCTGLTIDGLVNNLKSLKSPGGLNCLQINGLHGVTHRHYEELKLLLNPEKHKSLKTYKQRLLEAGSCWKLSWTRKVLALNVPSSKRRYVFLCIRDRQLVLDALDVAPSVQRRVTENGTCIWLSRYLAENVYGDVEDLPSVIMV